MTKARDNNPEPDPGLLSEEQILDWIDGRVSPQDASRLAAMSGRAGLEQRVAQMRANKRALVALGNVSAPRDVHDRVLAALEREALVREGESDAIPISTVVFEDEPRRRSWLHSAGAPLALAAGLLLLVSGGVYWIATANKRPGPVPGPIAMKADQGDPVIENPGPVDEPPTMIAMTAEATPAHVPDAGVAGIVEDQPAIMLAAHSAPIDDTRALELARQGRLVMRVVATNTKGLASLERDVSRPQSGREWKLDSKVSATLAQAVTPKNVPFGLGSRDEFAYASADAMSMLGPKAAFTWPLTAMTDRASRVKGTYLADVPARESTLRAVKALLADKLDAKIVFEELGEAVKLPQRLDADSALWWTRPTAKWTQRVSIPVVVEQR